MVIGQVLQKKKRGSCFVFLEMPLNFVKGLNDIKAVLLTPSHSSVLLE